VRYHRDLEATHSYRSSPAGWPVLARPVLQYREGCPADEQDRQDREEPCVVEPGERALILGVGNPVVWWTALLAYPLLAWQAVRHRRPAAGVVLLALLALWLPWFLAGKPGYLFYLVPAVPFIALAAPVALAGLRPRRTVAALAGLLALLAVAAFAFFYPVLTGAPLSVSAVELRLWLSSWG
jgi:dolichyl-phosphate-mannose-protein mannosyltransferase